MTANVRAPAAEQNGERPVEPDTLPGSLQWRLTALKTLLDRACVAWTGVRAAGRDEEIAVVEAPSTELAALAGLAREIRVLGFRYITLDLAANAIGSTRPETGPDPATGVSPTDEPE